MYNNMKYANARETALCIRTHTGEDEKSRDREHKDFAILSRITKGPVRWQFKDSMVYTKESCRRLKRTNISYFIYLVREIGQYNSFLAVVAQNVSKISKKNPSEIASNIVRIRV